MDNQSNIKLPCENFCIAPWSTLYKHTDSTVKLCCVDKGDSLGSLNFETVEKIRNNEEFVDIRRQFLNNKKPERCSDCWDKEEQGIQSYRQSLNNQIDYWYQGENPFFGLPALSVKNLDFRTSNLCNLACKSCNPIFSSKHVSLWKEFGWITDIQADTYQQKLKTHVKIHDLRHILNDVKSIYFAGGEPMITDDHWYILKTLKENHKSYVGMVYNTNMTTLDFKEHSVDEYWDYFASVHLMCSIDGIGKMFEYTRTGADWNSVLENLRRAAQFKNVKMGMSSTIGWLNLKSVLDLFKFVVEEKIVIDNSNLNLNMMVSPAGSGLKETPPEVAKELIKDLNSFKLWLGEQENVEALVGQTEACINVINTSKFNEDNFLSWIKRNKLFDDKYNLCLFDVYPFESDELLTKLKEIYNE